MDPSTCSGTAEDLRRIDSSLGQLERRQRGIACTLYTDMEELKAQIKALQIHTCCAPAPQRDASTSRDIVLEQVEELVTRSSGVNAADFDAFRQSIMDDVGEAFRQQSEEAGRSVAALRLELDHAASESRERLKSIEGVCNKEFKAIREQVAADSASLKYECHQDMDNHDQELRCLLCESEERLWEEMYKKSCSLLSRGTSSQVVEPGHTGHTYNVARDWCAGADHPPSKYCEASWGLMSSAIAQPSSSSSYKGGSRMNESAVTAPGRTQALLPPKALSFGPEDNEIGNAVPSDTSFDVSTVVDTDEAASWASPFKNTQSNHLQALR